MTEKQQLITDATKIAEAFENLSTVGFEVLDNFPHHTSLMQIFYMMGTIYQPEDNTLLKDLWLLLQNMDKFTMDQDNRDFLNDVINDLTDSLT